jgi:hypothetical protein
MSKHRASKLAIVMVVAGAAFGSACGSSAAPEPLAVAVTHAPLSAADGSATQTAAAQANAPVPLPAAEIAARAAIAVESPDMLSPADRKRYYEAQRDAAKQALALQKSLLKGTDQGRDDLSKQGADSATLSAVDEQVSRLKSHSSDLETRLQKFEQGANAAQ